MAHTETIEEFLARTGKKEEECKLPPVPVEQLKPLDSRPWAKERGAHLDRQLGKPPTPWSRGEAERKAQRIRKEKEQRAQRQLTERQLELQSYYDELHGTVNGEDPGIAAYREAFPYGE